MVISKDLKANHLAESYILSCIDNSGYNDITLNTDHEKLIFAYDTFYSEVGKWRVPQVGMHRAVEDWLAGLASACSIECRNHLIIKLAISWGLLADNSSDDKIDNFLNKYFYFMATKLINLWRKHEIYTF